MTQEDQIKAALERLLSRGNADAFVIFQHGTSGKFVQFAGSASEPLLLDLPSQALNMSERERAETLFAERAQPLQLSRQTLGQQFGFQMQFERDVGTAAAFTVLIFREVYRLPGNASLSIEEN